MTNLNMPIKNTELVERVNLITPYEISRAKLISLFGKAKGNNVTTIVTKAQFNEWFSAIQNGKPFAFVDASGKIIPLSYSIESDSIFKFINFTAYDKFGSSSFTLLGMTLALELNSSKVYLDSKSALGIGS